MASIPFAVKVAFDPETPLSYLKQTVNNLTKLPFPECHPRRQRPGIRSQSFGCQYNTLK